MRRSSTVEADTPTLEVGEEADTWEYNQASQHGQLPTLPNTNY